MQSSLTITSNYLNRSQTSASSPKQERSRYWLIGGGIITLPIVISWSLLQWIVKQNWTMLPV